MFDRFGEMFQNVTIGSLLVVIAIIAGIVLTAMYIAKKRAKKNRQPKSSGIQKQSVLNALVEGPDMITAPGKDTGEDKQPDIQRKTLYGAGEYKAMVYTKEGKIDFTSIPKPVGNVYIFEPSLPITGSGFIVKEDSDGEIVEYTPSNIEITTEELPEWGWFAIHCKEIIRRFWVVPAPWWRSVSMWFAAGMLLIVFICFLAVFGG